MVSFSSLSYCEELPNPDENNLANFHLQDEECAGACHEKEAPSEELTFEYQSCIECHGVMTEVGGKPHNEKHQDGEEMTCMECHMPHEEFDPKEICTDCHEDDEEAISGYLTLRMHKISHLKPWFE